MTFDTFYYLMAQHDIGARNGADMQSTGINGGRHRARAAALGAAVALIVLAAAFLAWHGMLGELGRLEHRGTVQTPDALPVLLWAGLLLSLLWAALLIALATTALLRHSPGDGGGRAVPQTGGTVARLTGVLLAVTALSSLSTVAPALAATASVVTPAGHVARTAPSCADDAVPTPGWLPDQPTRTEQLAHDCASLVIGNPVADHSGEVVVHRGDTLWSIAAARLGPQADAQAIAAEWPRWYAANRHLIGNDPDLLRVGARLLTPDLALKGSNR